MVARNSTICGIFALVIFVFLTQSVVGLIIYVDGDANGLNNGSSWTDAYVYLQDALAHAFSGDEIRVADSIYKPDMGGGNTAGDRTATFQLINGVAILGGYAGFGAPDPNARDITAYETVLSGDLNGDDIYVSDPCDLLTEPTRGENSYNVLQAIDTSTTLDGFTISGGNTSEYGGGMLVSGIFGDDANVIIENCIFRNCSAGSGGGGLCHRWGGRVTIINCSFIKNMAGSWGGGIYVEMVSATVISKCTITGNYGSSGIELYESTGRIDSCTIIGNQHSGVVCDISNPIISNCLITDNVSTSTYYGGGINVFQSIPIIKNCSIAYNSGSRAGGLYARNYLLGHIPISITNCIMLANAAFDGPQVYLQDSSINIQYSNIQGGEELISVDPYSILNWGEGNMDESQALTPEGHLKSGSLCIDSGDPNVIVDPNAPNDIDSEDRILNGRLDMGADEFLDTDRDHLPDFWEQKYFGDTSSADPNADPDGDGLTNLEEYEVYSSNPFSLPYYVDARNTIEPLANGTFEFPFGTIQEGIDAASDGDTVLVAAATYSGPGNFELDYSWKTVIVRSMSGSASATIDCGNVGRAVNFETIRGIFAVLEGFTITGGYAEFGGGIGFQKSHFLFKDCVLKDNTAAVKGGGIYSHLSTTTLNNLIIQDNSAPPNEPNTGLIEFSNISLQGDLTLDVGRLDVHSSWFYGPGRINLSEDTLLKVTGESGAMPTVIRTDVNGPGDIEIDTGQQLIVEGYAVVNMSGTSECNPDPNTGGHITVNGSLFIRGNATLMSTDVDVKLLDVEGDNDISFNNITLLETSTGFGGEFFVGGNATIACNTIISEGDRYLDLDPDPSSPDRPTITNNQITVIVKEGTLGSQGTLLELRAADYNCGGPNNPDCTSGAYQVPPTSPGFTADPSENWVLEKLILEPNAKLNLTNRQGFEFQDLSDANIGDWETVYVKELVMGSNSILNTGLQTLYYQRLVDENGIELLRDPNDPYAPLANGSRFQDIPVLGFSLGIIAMDDTTSSPHNEFDIRVRKRLRDPCDVQPEPPEPPKEGFIERIYNDPNIPVDTGGVMDMRTQASGKQSASSVGAKGAFARAGDEEITIEFEYKFIEDPNGEAEMIVYLSDDPEVSRNLREVARIRPPALDRSGSIGSGKFAIFSSTFSRGDLNFVRGTYVELELRGTNARCFIDNWDPRIYCSSTKCGDYGWLSGVVNVFDYLMLLAEFGLSSPSGVDKGCLDLVDDGIINNDDLLAWDISSKLNMCPWVSGASMSGATVAGEVLPPILELGIQYVGETAPLLIFGKPTISEMSTPVSYLYPVDSDGICKGDTIEPACPTPPCEGNSGRFVADNKGNIYQINAELGIIRQDGTVVVGPDVLGYGNSLVLIGLHNGEGLMLTDAAFHLDDPNIIYVVPVQVRPPAGEGCPYMAAAQIELTGAGKYNLLKLYGRNPVEYSTQLPTDCSNVGDFVYEPDLQHLHEIEIDSDGTLYILSAQWTNKNNWLLIYDYAIGNDSEVCVWLNNPNLIDPNLLTGPSAMVVSSVEEKVYLTSSATVPMDSNDLSTKVYCFSINKDPHTQASGLMFDIVVEVNCPEPTTNICNNYPQLCELNRCVSVITSMAEDHESGTLYVTGFTAPKFKDEAEWSPYYAPDFFTTPQFFTTPMLAVIPVGVNTVEAVEITNYEFSLPLVLPLSIVWTGLNNCSMIDVDNNGNVNFLDFAALVSYWLEPDCIHLDWCSGADVNRSNVVDWKDLAILVQFWLESGCEN